MAIEDYLAALFGGQTGTDDPARAGIAQIPLAEAPLPPPIPGPLPPPIPPPSIPPPSPDRDADLRRQYDAAIAKYSQTEGKHGQGYYNSEQSGRPEPESFDQYRARWQSPTSQPGGAGDNQAPPRVLATLSNASPVQAPGGGDLPVNLIGPQTGPYAALQQVAQNAQGGSQQPATPMQPPAPQPAPSQSGATSYGPLMDRILRQIDAREKSSWSDNLLRFGLAAMAAGGKPGATTLGALGEGGLSALSAQDANRGQDLKALLTGAQATNALTESGLKGTQLDRLRTLPQTVAGILNDTDKAPTGGAPSASGVGQNAPQGPLPPNMSKIASTLSDLGHTPAQIAGALGWGSVESGAQDTNPRILNDKGKDGAAGGAYGWQQWLASRRDDLKRFAQENNARVDDPVIQARFFDHEMRTSGSGASGRGGDTAQTAYWAAKTPGDAVVAMAHYGRGENYSLNNPQGTVGFGDRLAAAQKFYGALTGGSGGSGGAPTGGATGSPGSVGGVTLPASVPPGKALALANAFAGVPGYEHIVSHYTGLAKPPEGFTWGPGGTQAAITGGPHDPGTVFATSSAKSRGEFRDVRPGGFVAQGGQIVAAAPQLVEGHDPNTGAPYRFYTTAPLPGQAAQAPAGTPALPGAPAGAIPAGVSLPTGHQIKIEQEGFDEAKKSYSSAQDIKQRLNMMDHAIDVLNQSGWSSTGTGAQTRIGAAKDINSAFRGLGIPPLFDPEKVASWEALNKETTRAGFEVAGQLGSREALQIVKSATAAVPNADNTEMGARLVSSSLRQAAQRQADYYQFLNGWQADPSHAGRLQGADIAFNEIRPPSFYTDRAIKIAEIPSAAIRALKANPNLAGQFNQKYGDGMSQALEQ